MTEIEDNYSNLLTPYGLSEEMATLYLYLLKHGFSTAVVLSRELHMGRTKIYRLLDKLKEKGLVEFKVNERGMQFGSTHPQKFKQLLIEKEEELTILQRSLPDVIDHLTSLGTLDDTESKVLYYEGIEGLKQVSYNITHAKDIVRVFEMEHMEEFIPFDFAESIREKLVERKILTRDLTNKRSFPDYTNVTEMVQKYSEFRYLDPKQLTINFEVLIYNNVYATYSYKNGTIFCVEIYNEQLAEMQKQIFDSLWQQARPIEYITKKGAAQLR